MYIIKHRSRRISDKPGTFYYIVCGYAGYSTAERAVDALIDLLCDVAAA